MAYKNGVYTVDAGFNRSLMAFRIMPEIPESAVGTNLIQIVGRRGIVEDHDAMVEMKNAITAASDEEIRICRKFLVYHLKELEDYLYAKSLIALRTKHSENEYENIEQIFKGVYNDAEGIFRDIMTHPKSEENVHMFNSVMTYLAEMIVFTDALSKSVDERFDVLSSEISDAYIKLAKEMVEFKSATKNAYPHINQTVLAYSNVLQEAESRFNNQNFYVPKISGKKLELIREKLESDGARLNIDEIRNNYIGLIDRFNDVINGSGFFNEVRLAASMANFIGENIINDIDSESLNSIKNLKRDLFVSQEEHDADIKQRISSMPESRFKFRARAASLLDKAKVQEAFLQKLEGSVSSNKEFNEMVFSRDPSGAVVGVCNKIEDYAFVIYRDHDTSHLDAVFIVKLPKDRISDPLPSLSDVRKSDHRAVSETSLDKALLSLGDEDFRDYFFDGLEIHHHNGFQILNEERKSINAQLAHGDKTIEDFSDYTNREIERHTLKF